MAFFFSAAHDEIDFLKGYEFLDKELEKVVRDAELGKRFADKLVKVYLADGQEKWLLIHLEVQGYYDKAFEKRMYTYNYRIYDRYDKEVISLAILTDEDEGYRPYRYEVNRWGFKLLFEFPVIKLLDYREKIKELENECANPFGLIIAAHLRSLETNKDYNQRLFWKISLVKSLYERGFSRKDILNLYRFIDWLMVLPKELSLKFHETIKEYEEEKKMAYITTAERIGLEKGLEEGLEKGLEKGLEEGFKQGLLEAISLGLEIKFGQEGLLLYEKISHIEEVEKLEAIKNVIKKAVILSEVEKFII